jgi:hypothetical protein
MAGGYQAVISEIEKAGKAAGRVADEVRGVDPASAVLDGDAGLAGTRMIGKLAALKQAWTGKGQQWAGGFASYADDLTKAAALYSGNEQDAEHDLNVFQGTHVGGPKAI